MKDTAIPLLVPSEDGKFSLDEEALDKILDGKQEPIVIISVAGAFRRGKSFLLNYFIQYLETGGLGLDAPLGGFDWRGGAERETTGILAWPKLYPKVLPTGEKVLILIIDTQGTFDSTATFRESATIFSLSTLLSSVQIYNLSQNIQEDDLQHLQFFADYGKLAAANNSVPSHVFQKLVFLVRDWPYPYEIPYGERGGSILMDRRLKVSSKMHRELLYLRNYIHSSFTELSCYLLPHPGEKVVVDPTFDGRPCDLNQEFRNYLTGFIKSILEPEKLVMKRVGNQLIKAQDIIIYFKAYFNMFNGDTLPCPASIITAAAEANNIAAVHQGKNDYQNTMQNFCYQSTQYIKVKRLEAEHNKTKGKVIQEFVDKPKMGGEEFSQPYQKQLETDVEILYKQFQSLNENRSFFSTLLTPLVLTLFTVVCYIFSEITDLLGLVTFTRLLNISVVFFLLSSIFWSYARFTGEFPAAGVAIDYFALMLWENIVKPIHYTLLESNFTYGRLFLHNENTDHEKID